MKKDSIIILIRIVYDCSCKDKIGYVSLNDCIELYFFMMNDIMLILIRFRLNKFVVIVDIEKVFF